MRPLDSKPNKIRLYRLTAAVLILSSIATPAFAVNKDMVQLQTQVQQLLDAVARLQQSNDERMGVLKDLVQQNSDSVNRMSVTVDALQKQITAQQAAQGGKIDTVSGQIQSLNDSLDELKARMNKLEKVLGDVNSQQQTMNATIQNLPQAGATPGAAQATTPPPTTPPAASGPLTTSAAVIPPPPGKKPAGLAPAAPPAGTPLVDDMYKSAFNDFMAARYAVSAAEFNDLIKAYPDSTLSGNAHYYLGEIDYRGAHYSTAVKDYDKVIEQYPDNNKVPAAHLHKGQALVEMQLKEKGVLEFRALIQRFPNSPEAAQARSKLNAMGVAIKPKS